ncbi:hypothetical protein RB598_006188 [Gaeumannomyces tritici]
MSPKFKDAWYYPNDIAHDLDGLTVLPEAMKQEVYACAWEYTRCVIPQYTNWKRYVAFMRTIIIGIIAEFRGELVDVAAGDSILGYSLDGVLDALFEGTPGHALMAREYKTFLLITAEKTGRRRDHELFRRYVNGLASGPRAWFRMRDCDALARFSLAAALACCDVTDRLPSPDQLELLTEIGDTLYDAVAFYKHRSEGETNNTFAYVPEESRVRAYSVARELLWALDVAYAGKPEGVPLMNFVRFFGGPIHMMMRRYRFVEEGLTIGRAETDVVVAETRRNVKLWNRVDAVPQQPQQPHHEGTTEAAGGHSRGASIASTPTNADSSSSRSSSTSGPAVSSRGSDTSVEDDGGKPPAAVAVAAAEVPGVERFHELLKRSDQLMFPELPAYLERSAEQYCDRCGYQTSYGARRMYRFGGVDLCVGCRAMWRGYIESLPERVQEAFPDVVLKTPPPQPPAPEAAVVADPGRQQLREEVFGDSCYATVP